MSYKITVYFNDEDIATTRIFGANGFVDLTKSYGASAYSATGFSGTTTFTATPADGCIFTQWVYRVGGTTATQQTSTSNPFRYSGTEELIIRAEGEAESVSEPSWTRYTRAFGTISSLSSASISLDEYELYRYSVSFEESGTAYFYTEGTEVDVCGYLSIDGSWDSEYGEPSDYLKYDDDGHGAPNFGIQYEVEAGTTYYVWVRGLSEYASGDVTLYIEPPAAPTWSVSSASYGTLSADKTASLTLSSYQMYRRTVYFSESGTATFYTTGSIDTRGYLTTDTSWDSSTGVPSYPIASDDDSGDGNNFSISYDVTAGQKYYIWVRGYNESTSGTVTLNITVPETATRPNDFAWTYSKVKGGTFNLTAAEWNTLTSRINAFREYKGLSDYSFNTAYSGNNYMAYMYNQARLAIQGISGYGTYIPTVSSGNTVTAYMMNILVSELNSIP